MENRQYDNYRPSGTFAYNSANQASADESLGVRQSPWGKSEPPDSALGPIGYGRALEMADSKETIEEDFQPMLDTHQIILIAFLQQQQIGPETCYPITPDIIYSMDWPKNENSRQKHTLST